MVAIARINDWLRPISVNDVATGDQPDAIRRYSDRRAAVVGSIWNVAAYRHGKASAIQTAEATRLIIALLIDLAVFAIVPDLGAILGIMLIAVAVGWHDCRTVLWRVIRGGHDSLKAKLNRKDATASIANIADDSGRFG